MAKPDNRSDNVDHLQEIVEHTVQHIDETEEYVSAHEDEMDNRQKQELRLKNERRKQSLPGLRQEIEDEAEAQQDHSSH